MVAVGGSLLIIGIAAAVAAVPADPVIRKYDEDRYQYVRVSHGTPHLVDMWMKASDVAASARYNPDRQNIYHLFTRDNPTVSQPMLIGNEGLLALTNYDSKRRTAVLIHGWQDSATANVNAVLVPAFLQAENMNVIVVDWSAGADTLNYLTGMTNTVLSGESVARFINWLNLVTGVTASNYHIVGIGLGGHQAGVLGRNVEGDVAYITALDPSFSGWITNSNKLTKSDSSYTEVIHTNAGLLGYIGLLGHADFYPNGGINMPGCSSQQCDHDRSFHYFAESLISGGFTGRRCATYITAMTGSCLLGGNLQMGGLVPKTGQSGIFHLVTNRNSPFSRS